MTEQRKRFKMNISWYSPNEIDSMLLESESKNNRRFVSHGRLRINNANPKQNKMYNNTEDIEYHSSVEEGEKKKPHKKNKREYYTQISKPKFESRRIYLNGKQNNGEEENEKKITKNSDVNKNNHNNKKHERMESSKNQQNISLPIKENQSASISNEKKISATATVNKKESTATSLPSSKKDSRSVPSSSNKKDNASTVPSSKKDSTSVSHNKDTATPVKNVSTKNEQTKDTSTQSKTDHITENKKNDKKDDTPKTNQVQNIISLVENKSSTDSTSTSPRSTDPVKTQFASIQQKKEMLFQNNKNGEQKNELTDNSVEERRKRKEEREREWKEKQVRLEQEKEEQERLKREQKEKENEEFKKKRLEFEKNIREQKEKEEREKEEKRKLEEEKRQKEMEEKRRKLKEIEEENKKIEEKYRQKIAEENLEKERKEKERKEKEIQEKERKEKEEKERKEKERKEKEEKEREEKERKEKEREEKEKQEQERLEKEKQEQEKPATKVFKESKKEDRYRSSINDVDVSILQFPLKKPESKDSEGNLVPIVNISKKVASNNDDDEFNLTTKSRKSARMSGVIDKDHVTKNIELFNTKKEKEIEQPFATENTVTLVLPSQVKLGRGSGNFSGTDSPSDKNEEEKQRKLELKKRLMKSVEKKNNSPSPVLEKKNLHSRLVESDSDSPTRVKSWNPNSVKEIINSTERRLSLPESEKNNTPLKRRSGSWEFGLDFSPNSSGDNSVNEAIKKKKALADPSEIAKILKDRRIYRNSLKIPQNDLLKLQSNLVYDCVSPRYPTSSSGSSDDGMDRSSFNKTKKMTQELENNRRNRLSTKMYNSVKKKDKSPR